MPASPQHFARIHRSPSVKISLKGSGADNLEDISILLSGIIVPLEIELNVPLYWKRRPEDVQYRGRIRDEEKEIE
ncbi:hypothetical protein DMENIID0001_039490 [Sergentomyia squamirostris]